MHLCSDPFPKWGRRRGRRARVQLPLECNWVIVTLDIASTEQWHPCNIFSFILSAGGEVGTNLFQ